MNYYKLTLFKCLTFFLHSVSNSFTHPRVLSFQPFPPLRRPSLAPPLVTSVPFRYRRRRSMSSGRCLARAQDASGRVGCCVLLFCVVAFPSRRWRADPASQSTSDGRTEQTVLLWNKKSCGIVGSFFRGLKL